MSQGALFAFGAVIFFVVVTGGFMYGLMRNRELADRQGYGSKLDAR